MTIPTNLETTQAVAETFKSLMATNGWDINALLLTTFFYFQLWHIPLTWVCALLCGTCMPTLLESGTWTHMLNAAGVFINWYLSGIFLAKLIKKSKTLKGHLKQIET